MVTRHPQVNSSFRLFYFQVQKIITLNSLTVCTIGYKYIFMFFKFPLLLPLKLDCVAQSFIASLDS